MSESVRGRLRGTIPAWLAVAAVGAGLLIAAASLGPRSVTAAAPVSDNRLVQQLTGLAADGRYDALRNALVPYQANDRAATLIDQLEQRHALETQRLAARAEALEAALAEKREWLAKDRLDKAMASLIEAHGLATDPEALLAEPEHVELIGRVVADAERAVAEQDWLEALTLYHRLKLLYEDRGLYREEAKAAAAHIRLVQIYAPERLREMTRERAIALGEEPEEESGVEFDKWEERVDGIDLAMLRQTLRQAAFDHVASLGYRELMQDAVVGMLRLLETDDLTATFEGMADSQKREAYIAYLKDLGATLDRQNYEMAFVDAISLADRIIGMNDQTVRLPRRVVLYELTEGITGRLDDYSSVIWPSDVPALMRSTQGTFSGVGIQISRQENELVVVSPLENTPAQRAGIKAGDRIIRVDGKPTTAWTLTRAVDEITGPEGSNVELTIAREGEAEDLDFVLRRSRIAIESIKGWEHRPGGGWDYMIDPEARIGYVRMSSFIPDTAADLDAAVQQISASGDVGGLILDLRFNPGGLLTAAIEVSDRFIEEGKLVWTVDGDGDQSGEAKAKRRRTYDNFPVVVLVNQGSASASEIVAGALQSYDRALIVGTRSFGKGSVQDLFPLSRGRAFLKLTTQYYVIPSGRIIHRLPDAETWGIEPDLEIVMTDAEVSESLLARQAADVLRDPEEASAEGEEAATAARILEEGLDPQLEAALFWLRTHQLADQLTVASRQ
ncbi:S41 family peptidase [Mucisphaera sp.]|uniref:S41 family peptidase n=1 Tax=Mucisphaera sp. TaxID=2913024 RepID=UPI003D116A78